MSFGSGMAYAWKNLTLCHAGHSFSTLLLKVWKMKTLVGEMFS